MTLTPERIAEIEAWVTGKVPTHSDALSQDDILHLCRLARLGQKVEAAPVGLLRSVEWTSKPKGSHHFRCVVEVGRVLTRSVDIAQYTGHAVALLEVK